MSFEEEYQDVLQNIEFAIVSVYREDPELLDYDVEKVLNSLSRSYRHGEAPPPPSQFSEQQKRVYAQVKQMCDFRLGHGELTTEEGEVLDFEMKPLSSKEIVDCLRRIQKSVQRWTKQGGRQGYLTFISQYIV